MARPGIYLRCSLLALIMATPSFAASSGPVALPVPSTPTLSPRAASPIDTPLTGAAETPHISDTTRPPSMEALMLSGRATLLAQTPVRIMTTPYDKPHGPTAHKVDWQPALSR